MEKIKMTKKTAFAMAQEALNTIDTEDARMAWDVIQKEIDRLERVAMKAKTSDWGKQFEGKNVDHFEYTKSGASADYEVDAIGIEDEHTLGIVIAR